MNTINNNSINNNYPIHFGKKYHKISRDIDDYFIGMEPVLKTQEKKSMNKAIQYFKDITVIDEKGLIVEKLEDKNLLNKLLKLKDKLIKKAKENEVKFKFSNTKNGAELTVYKKLIDISPHKPTGIKVYADEILTRIKSTDSILKAIKEIINSK